MDKKWVRKLFLRRAIMFLFMVLQVGLIIYPFVWGGLASKIVTSVLTVISIAVCIYIISNDSKGAYKLTWVFIIMLFPMFGGLMYLIFSFQALTRSSEKDIKKIAEKTHPLWELPQTAHDELCKTMPEHSTKATYLQKFADFPVYADTETKFLPSGEEMLPVLLEELKKAEKYIFFEYFIIQEGIMWDSILDVLKEKASKGVKVRLIYDDIGCLFTLPKDYRDTLKKAGIEAMVFNPFKPLLSATQNNRDHRKITVIDGKVAFTGGINLADEYINAIEKYGHWKDSGVLLKGKAAWSLTLMFLQMWEVCTGINEDYRPYYPWDDEPCTVKAKGYVQPYTDSPRDYENIGEHVYIQIINNAKKYVYINTPYLIVDENVSSAIRLAAKSGVDVRIVTPHKWDKFFVHMTTRSYYRDFIKAGVRIYEYSKGFNHSKTFVSDDEVATVGTTNLDYRSLYLNFECGALMYGTDSVAEVKEDFLKTLEICQEVTEKDCKHNLFVRIFQDFLRIFAPLM